MSVKGYRIKESNGRLNPAVVCKDCASKIPLNTSSDNITELTTSNYGTFHCTICEDDVTRGGGRKKINYPEEIALLFKKTFEERGPRFGGVHPIIDSAGKEEKELSKGAKKVEPIKTQYDPVIIEVRDKSLANDINKMIDTVSQLGRIQGRMQEIENEDGEVAVYEFRIFAVQ